MIETKPGIGIESNGEGDCGTGKDESDPSETRVVEPTTAQAHDMRVPLNMGPSI